MLGRRHVLPSVPSLLTEIQVEGTFQDGSYLVTIHDPISTDDGDLEAALYGSFLPIPSQDQFPLPDLAVYAPERKPGAVIVVKGEKITLNPGRKRCQLRVTNKGDRPIQVGSHYPFIKTNPLLEFDRRQAYNCNLDIPAGTAVRFEPGESKTVTLVEITKGKHGTSENCRPYIKANRTADFGFEGDSVNKLEDIMKNLIDGGFAHVDAPVVPQEQCMIATMERDAYAAMFGPTAGDLVRLGDTELWIKIERDYIGYTDCTGYGDECKFGGGKTIREGMGQCSGAHDSGCLDLVITGAVIVDWTGIYKADIGVKEGHIVGLGKAGNPEIMGCCRDMSCSMDMVIGSTTDVIAAEGMIVTYGGMDSHVWPSLPNKHVLALMVVMIGPFHLPTTSNRITCIRNHNSARWRNWSQVTTHLL